jgi:hypothetical protein
MAAGGPGALTVENAGDDRVGIMGGQPTNQSDGVFVGPHHWRIGARQTDFELGDRAAAPVQGEIGSELGSIDGDYDLFEQAAQQCQRRFESDPGLVEIGNLVLTHPASRPLFPRAGTRAVSSPLL